MNLDKKAKKGFDKIRISALDPRDTENVIMKCEDVKKVLNGNGTCKVFYGTKNVLIDGQKVKQAQLGYSCNGGKVARPIGKTVE